MRKKYLPPACTLVLITLCLIAQAQQQKRIRDAIGARVIPWNEGSILLNDGRELQGMLQYNHQTGILAFRHAGGESQALGPRSVIAFRFFDEDEQRRRTFISLDNQEPQTTLLRRSFYEVLAEFKHFAVLMKTEPLQYIASELTEPRSLVSLTYFTTRLYVQRSTIYFMNRRGEIKPYLQVVEKDMKGLVNGTTISNRVIDEKLLKIYTGDYYDRLKSFTETFGLNPGETDDLLEILCYYKSLTGP